jgi:hypothetical protein
LFSLFQIFGLHQGRNILSLYMLGTNTIFWLKRGNTIDHWRLQCKGQIIMAHPLCIHSSFHFRKQTASRELWKLSIQGFWPWKARHGLCLIHRACKILSQTVAAVRGMHYFKDRCPFQRVKDSSVALSWFGRNKSWKYLLSYWTVW